MKESWELAEDFWGKYMDNEPMAWTGEEWEKLAYELCANEYGEESCMDMIWTMDVIPEPWGERWLKFEGEAKHMIAMVKKCTHPTKTLTDEEINVVAILQDAEIVPAGHEIWKTQEEFNRYKRIVLATAKALRKAQ